MCEKILKLPRGSNRLTSRLCRTEIFNKHLESTELALYYPLSPIMSLLITKEQIHNIKCSYEKAKEYNDMIQCHSLELIFASDESVLQTYISAGNEV